MDIHEQCDAGSNTNSHWAAALTGFNSGSAGKVLKLLHSKDDIGTELFEVQGARFQVAGTLPITIPPSRPTGMDSSRWLLTSGNQAERLEQLDPDPEYGMLGLPDWTLPSGTATTGSPVPVSNSTVIDQSCRDEERRDRDVQELLLVDWDNEFLPERYMETSPKGVSKIKKTRVSRKGKKSGPHVPIIEREWFGPLQVIERVGNDGRHRCVSIFCSLCGEEGQCRFGELRDGVVKSCGCLERAADGSFQESLDNWVAHLETRERKDIFRQIVTRGTTQTMESRGLSKRACDTLWRRERDRLARIPQPTLSTICHMAKSETIPAAARTYKLAHAEVIHILQTADRAEKKKKRAIQVAWMELDEASQAQSEHILRVASDYIDEALENAEIKEWREGSKNRWFGELTQAEFCSGKKYSYFGWVYAVACLMPEDVAQAMFGDRVIRFIRLVQNTVANRASRRRRYSKAQEAGLKPVRKTHKVKWARRTDGYYDPCQDAALTVERMTLIGSLHDPAAAK